MRAVLLLAWLVAIASDTFGQTTVSLDLPADLPTGLPTIVAGEMNEMRGPGTMLELSHPKLGEQKLLGQCEGGKRIWVALTATKEMVGEPLKLTATDKQSTLHLNIDEGDDGVRFLDDDREVLFYQKKPLTRHEHTRAGFVHPLRGLDSETFTEIFPADHRHHQGVFWAWHQLWVGDRKIGDPWVTKDHLVVVRAAAVTDLGPLYTELRVSADWQSPLLVDEDGEPRPIVIEDTTIRLYRVSGDAQYVDFTIRLEPQLPDVKIGGSENVKGYSGFTVRVKPPQDMVITDAAGIRDQDAVQTASPWADVSGSFGEGGTSGVAILSHPSLAQFPPRWLLRHYGMQNVAYPGREPVALSKDKPLVIRHRLVLHRGDAKQARVADHQRVYELTP